MESADILCRHPLRLSGLYSDSSAVHLGRGGPLMSAEPYMPDDTIEFSNILLHGVAPSGEHLFSEIHIGGTVNSFFIGQLPQFQEFTNLCRRDSTIQVENYAYSLGRNPDVVRKATKEEVGRIIDADFPDSYYDSLYIIEHEGPDQFQFTNGVVESNCTERGVIY